MELQRSVAACRRRRGLSLRDLALRAGTSHSTISAYEGGRVSPTVHTLERIVAAAGQRLEVRLVPDPVGPDRVARGRELEQVLELAAQFPARHDPTLAFPVFGRP